VQRKPRRLWVLAGADLQAGRQAGRQAGGQAGRRVGQVGHGKQAQK
jgi:hypothetical protein